MKEHSKKILILIVIIFIGITIAARIAYGMARIEVKTCNIEQLTIDKSFESIGTIIQNGGTNILTIDNQIVSSIDVHIGEYVENGTPLFCVDVKNVEKILKDKQDEISKIELSIEKEQDIIDQAVQNKNDAIASAEQSYNIANEKGNIMVETAYKEYEKSIQDRENYTSNSEDFPEKTLEELEMAVSIAEKAYNEAIWNKEELLVEASNAVRSANGIVIDETTVKSLEIDLNSHIEQFKKIESLKNDGGVIKSPTAGTVTDILVKKGEVMSEGVAMIIADTNVPNQVEVILEPEMANKVQVGTKVCLTGESKTKEEKTLSDLVINEIVKDEDENSKIIIETGTNLWNHGQKVQVKFMDKSDVYSMCVPLSAIRLEQNKYFVYVVEKRKTTMGMEDISKRYDVEVIDMGNQYAAIKSSEITEKTKIITDSDKMLQEESRIKVVN